MITVDNLLEFYGCKNDSALAKRCKVSKGAVSLWRSRGIHENTQAVFEVMSEGRLKAARKRNAHLAKSYNGAKTQA